MFFRNPVDPTMNELVNWFQIKFTDLANEMKDSAHAAEAHEPNPYHIEDSVWTHTMMVCLQAENDDADKINMICALLHDTGKPEARDVIPFDKPKPVHTETNQRREDDKQNSKTVGLTRETKTHFRGHEGISFYKSIDVLKALRDEGVVNNQEIAEILTIISHHGTLFDNVKDGVEFKPEVVKSKWKGDPYTFEKFVKQVKYDSLGRFFTSKDGRKSDAHFFGTSIFGNEFTEEMFDHFHGTRIIPSKSITALVGVPLSGKSTWIAENVKEGDVVISRDDTLMKFGQLKYGTTMCPKCNGHKDVGCDCHQGKVKLTYNEIWKHFAKDTERVEAENKRLKNQWVWDVMVVDVNTPEPTYETDDQAQVDRMIRSQFEIAVGSGLNIYIDMTNTSKKSRRKWFGFQVEGEKEYRTKFNTSFKQYGFKAVVFATGYNEIFERNQIRADETGKYIGAHVINNMMKSFMTPLYDEVFHVQWVI